MAFYIERTHHITKKPIYLKSDTPNQENWDSRYDYRFRYETEEEATTVRDRIKFGTVKSE